nr:hypothetical protein [Armatimonas rosea]
MQPPESVLFPKSLAALVLLGALVQGCQQAGSRLLGSKQAEAKPSTVAALKTATAPIALKGTMTDKCPTAACWFHLKDATGVVKVDVKAAGFTVTEIPNGAALQVSGRYNKETDEVEATGVRW